MKHTKLQLHHILICKKLFFYTDHSETRKAIIITISFLQYTYFVSKCKQANNKDQIHMYYPGYPELTVQNRLASNSRDAPAFASQVPGLKACTTVPDCQWT